MEGLGVDSLDFQTNIDDLKDEDILQLTPFCSIEQESELMLSLENCTSGRWHPAFTDITAAQADKGKGLQAMADYLGLNIDETMAFGDGGNDISIIKRLVLVLRWEMLVIILKKSQTILRPLLMRMG